MKDSVGGETIHDWITASLSNLTANVGGVLEVVVVVVVAAVVLAAVVRFLVLKNTLMIEGTR